MNFAKFSRTKILKNTFGRMHLKFSYDTISSHVSHEKINIVYNRTKVNFVTYLGNTVRTI